MKQTLLRLRPLLRSLIAKLNPRYIPRGRKQLSVTHLLPRGAGLAALFFALFSLSSAQAQTSLITIDSFATDQAPPLELFVPGDIGTSVSSTASGGGILGGERDIEIALTGGTFPGNRFAAGVGGGALFIGYEPTTEGTVQIQWDGPDGDPTALDPTGLGGVDLTVGGTQDSFEIDLIFDDLPVDIIIEVFTDGGNSSIFTLSTPGGIVPPVTTQTFNIPFTSFVPNLGAGADFMNVGAITWSLTAINAPDLVIDSFRTTGPPPTPTPTSTPTPRSQEEEEDEDEAGPPAAAPPPAPTPFPSPTPALPTMLPETGELPVVSRPLLIFIGLVLIVGLGALFRTRKSV